MNKCKRCKTSVSDGTWCDVCRDHRRRSKLRRQYWYKTQVYQLFGGCCAHCGNDDWRTLTLDHVNSDAGDDKHAWEASKRNSRWYIEVYKQIMINGAYHKELQLLCMNCHMIKDIYGGVSFSEYCEKQVAPLLMGDFKPNKK